MSSFFLSHEKVCKSWLYKFANDKYHQKVRDHCYFTVKYSDAAHSICNFRFNVSNKIIVVFHNYFNYYYQIITKELANKFERQFESLVGNTEKYKTYIASIEIEVTKNDKDGSESIATLSYKLRFISKARFMESSLSNLIDNLAEGFHKIKCKDFDYFLEYEIVKKNLIKYKCLPCNIDYSNKFDKKSKKRFYDIFKFSNKGINTFSLLLIKGAYSYE